MAQGPEDGDSVFDFIYVDHRRIDLYLAQFSEFGNLTTLVRSVRESDTRQVGFNAHVIRGEKKSGQETGIEKHYDAQWVAPLTFLDEIQNRQMLKPNTGNARIGDLVILPGTLNIVDMRAFQKSFDVMSGAPPGVSSSGINRKGRRARSAQPPAPAGDPAVGMKLLASLDQPIFMLFSTDRGNYWSTIDPSSIVGNSMDLHLKHGITIAGVWQLIGILDCLPGENSSPMPPRFCGDMTNEFSTNMGNVLRELRMIMGRPTDCYGITPLIILREIS